MQAQIVRGTKHEIADKLAHLAGQVREAIVFVEEPTAAPACDDTLHGNVAVHGKRANG